MLLRNSEALAGCLIASQIHKAQQSSQDVVKVYLRNGKPESRLCFTEIGQGQVAASQMPNMEEKLETCCFQNFWNKTNCFLCAAQTSDWTPLTNLASRHQCPEPWSVSPRTSCVKISTYRVWQTRHKKTHVLTLKIFRLLIIPE